MKKGLKEYWENTEAVGTVEIILILVVLIALVLIFQKKIVQLVNNIFTHINDSAQEIYG